MDVHFQINEIYCNDPADSEKAVEFILYDYFNPLVVVWMPPPTWYTVYSSLFETRVDGQPRNVDDLIRAGSPVPVKVSYQGEPFHWVVITGCCDETGVYYLYDPLLQVDANKTIPQNSLVSIWDRSYIVLT